MKNLIGIKILKVIDLKVPTKLKYKKIVQADQYGMAFVYEGEDGKLYGLRQCTDLMRKMVSADFEDELTIAYERSRSTSFRNAAYIVSVINHSKKRSSGGNDDSGDIKVINFKF